MGPLCPISIHGNPVTLLKFQMDPRLILLMSSGSKKEGPSYMCLSEAKASHSQEMWAEVSSFAPHLLHSGLPHSPIRWRCLLRVLCPVRRPVTDLDFVLLKDRNLALAPRQGPEINPRAFLWVSSRHRHHIQCWLTNQRLIILRISCLDSQGRLKSDKLQNRAVPCDLVGDLITSYPSMSRDKYIPTACRVMYVSESAVCFRGKAAVKATYTWKVAPIWHDTLPTRLKQSKSL